MDDLLDRKFEAFTTTEEAATRLTVEGWRRRLDVLSAFFPEGLEAGPALTEPNMRLDALYWMAQTLSLHGFPGRALTAYSQHDELCRSMGVEQAKRLASALAHHAKSLRQCGRFHDADILAREGLDLQQRVGSPFNIATSLYWFGMGLAQRGEHNESRGALDEALKLLDVQTKATDDDSGHQHTVIAMFRAQRALWEGDLESALIRAHTAFAQGSKLEQSASYLEKVGARKIRSATARMIGEILVAQREFSRGTSQLETALRLGDEMSFVEEVIPSLLGLAAASFGGGDNDGCRRWINATFLLTREGPYPLYDSNAHLQLAALEAKIGNIKVAKSAAQRSRTLAWCDGPPFSYARGVEAAETMLTTLD